jgi:hypothetical protein
VRASIQVRFPKSVSLKKKISSKRGTTEKAGAMGAEEVVQRLSSGPTIASYKTALFLSFFLEKKKKKKERTNLSTESLTLSQALKKEDVCIECSMSSQHKQKKKKDRDPKRQGHPPFLSFSQKI